MCPVSRSSLDISKRPLFSSRTPHPFLFPCTHSGIPFFSTPSRTFNVPPFIFRHPVALRANRPPSVTLPHPSLTMKSASSLICTHSAVSPCLSFFPLSCQCNPPLFFSPFRHHSSTSTPPLPPHKFRSRHKRCQRRFLCFFLTGFRFFFSPVLIQPITPLHLFRAEPCTTFPPVLPPFPPHTVSIFILPAHLRPLQRNGHPLNYLYTSPCPLSVLVCTSALFPPPAP